MHRGAQQRLPYGAANAPPRMPAQQMAQQRGAPPGYGAPQQRAMPPQQGAGMQQRGPPGGRVGPGTPDFMQRLQRAEEADSESIHGSAGGITLDNWEQRSKNMAKLAMQNEAAELAAKQRMGVMPMPDRIQQPGPPPGNPGGRPQSAQPQQPNVRQAMEFQRQQQQQQQMGRGYSAVMQQQQQQQQQMGRGYSAVMQQQQQQQQQQQMMRGGMQQQQFVQRQQAFDPWDDRVPSHLAAGGKILSGREARQQSRGQSSSIVFG